MMTKISSESVDKIIDPADIHKIKIGVKVRHARFGIGIVEDTEGTGNNLKASVKFANGQKKQLLLKFAKLEVVEN